MNEFEWETFLKQSDARTDKFQKLYEKYQDHPEQKKIVAQEMGWLRPETELKEDFQIDELLSSTPLEPLQPNPLTEGKDWVRDEDGDVHHPLTLRILNESVKMHRECQKNAIKDRAIHEMILQFQVCGAKVAGALDSLAYEDQIEGGFVVACLKRSLTFLHQSIDAAEKLKNRKSNLLFVERCEKTFFEVRGEIIDLMCHFRQTE
jgi:hypothetical protein